MRFIEAEANFTRLTGQKVNENLHSLLFPDCNETTRKNQISKLRTGKRTFFSLEMIQIICQECFVDPNFLFGFKLKE